jgi:hypothetical protein
MRQKPKVCLTIDPDLWLEFKKVCNSINMPYSRMVELLIHLLVDPNIKDATPQVFSAEAIRIMMTEIQGQQMLANSDIV